MKRIACICMAACLLLTVLVGCGTSGADETKGTPTGKVVVNFEGTVTAVDGGEVTLDSGKVVVITSDTVFAGDPDTGNAVSEEIAVGNFLQGYTRDDPDADRVTAHKIYCNASARTGGKLVVNFEGRVAAVEDDRIVLENSQVIRVTEDTVFSVAGGVVEGVIVSEGYTIQGHTGDAPDAAEITATRIHIIAY